MKSGKTLSIVLTTALLTSFGTYAVCQQKNVSLFSIASLFGDINSDGEVNAADAADILVYAAWKGAGNEGDLVYFLSIDETKNTDNTEPSASVDIMNGIKWDDSIETVKSIMKDYTVDFQQSNYSDISVDVQTGLGYKNALFLDESCYVTFFFTNDKLTEIDYRYEQNSGHMLSFADWKQKIKNAVQYSGTDDNQSNPFMMKGVLNQTTDIEMNCDSSNVSIILTNSDTSSKGLTTTIDESCIGTWLTDEWKTLKECQTNGGSTIEILSISGDTAKLCINTVSESARRCATTDTIAGKINGNTIEFKFEEDGWGNSGWGTLYLQGDTLTLSLSYNNVDPYAQWQLEESGTFHKVK